MLHSYYIISTRFSLSMEMSRLTRDGTAEPVSRNQIFRSERRQGNVIFPWSTDHEQDWQHYPVDPYPFAKCDDNTYTVYIHTYRCNHTCIYSSEPCTDVHVPK